MFTVRFTVVEKTRCCKHCEDRHTRFGARVVCALACTACRKYSADVLRRVSGMVGDLQEAMWTHNDSWLEHALDTDDCARWVQRFEPGLPYPALSVTTTVPSRCGMSRICDWMRKPGGTAHVQIWLFPDL